MPNVIARIDPGALDNHSKLFLDYVRSNGAGLPPYLGGFSADAHFWKKRLAGKRGSSWRPVMEEVSALSRRLGASETVTGKLGRDDVQLVVTGQQPGALGGPLHTIYKVATAVALAAAIETRTGAPCVALYWCGADDTDFAEIRRFTLVSRAGSPVSTSIPQEAHHGGVPVGDIDVEWLQRVWQAALPVIGGFDNRRLVESAIEEAFAAASDHGELAAAILLRLVQGRIAVVDGRSAAVRRYAQPLFERYVEEEGEIRALVEDRGRELDAAGYHAQLGVGTDSGVFLVEDGRRKAVGPEGRGLLRAAVRSNIEQCSPGVILRNLVQDSTFEPVAVVLGPAELAYRAQIGPLYERFGVRLPCQLPRLSATFVPADYLAPLSVSEGGADTLVLDPAAFMRDVYRHSLPEAVYGAGVELAERISKALDRYAGAVEEALPDKTRGKIRGRLAEVRNRTEALLDAATDAGKAVARERWPFAASIAEVVKPAGKPQDRTLSALTPYLWGGDDMVNDLVDLASLATDELLDGHFRHIV